MGDNQGRLYILGGKTNYGIAPVALLSDVWRGSGYPNNDGWIRWERLAIDMNVARCDFATVVIDDLIFILGGGTPNGAQNDIWVWNTSAPDYPWQKVPHNASHWGNRWAAKVEKDFQQNIVLMGGSNGRYEFNDIWIWSYYELSNWRKTCVHMVCT